MLLTLEQQLHLLNVLGDFGSSLAEFFIVVLQNTAFSHHTAILPLGDDTPAVLNALFTYGASHAFAVCWAHEYIENRYAEQILKLTSKEAGWHFGANHASIEKLEAFDLAAMSRKMHHRAPDVCRMVGRLLSADLKANEGRDARRRAREVKAKENREQRAARMDVDESDDSDDSAMYWDGLEDLENVTNALAEDRHTILRKRVIMIRQVTCLSLMMQSTNQHCNALQSMVGLYLHTCHVPQASLDLLAHMGCSISTLSINNAITSLSNESSEVIKRIGRMLLASYIYDNLDADLKISVPTVEKPQNMLIHITAGMLVPLEHGVTLADLDCSAQLWNKSRLNSNALPSDVLAGIDFYRLTTIHAEHEEHELGLLRHE
ncbi:unnamed protein product [Somion occarium]|uniref:Uncharacterized protein n=1 Tax=Somion occarium TaxID=3059160 RepID=A0ABP1DNB2_9APHY